MLPLEMDAEAFSPHPDFRITICHTNLVIVKMAHNGMLSFPATQSFRVIMLSPPAPVHIHFKL
jgi:hypothetical protein